MIQTRPDSGQRVHNNCKTKHSCVNIVVALFSLFPAFTSFPSCWHNIWWNWISFPSSRSNSTPLPPSWCCLKLFFRWNCVNFLFAWGFKQKNKHAHTATRKTCSINFTSNLVNFTRKFWIQNNTSCECVWVCLFVKSFIYSESGVLIKTMASLRSKSSWWMRKSCLFLFVLWGWKQKQQKLKYEIKISWWLFLITIPSREEICESCRRKTKMKNLL